MTVKTFGGGGGGGVEVPLTSHTEDGDTMSHWTFASDLTDAVGTVDLAGTYFQTKQDDNDNAQLNQDDTMIKTSPGAAYTGLDGAMSFGMLIRIDQLPASYCAVFSCQPIGGGSGSSNNIAFGLRLLSDGTLLWLQEYGSKTASTQAIALTMPVGQWCWLGASRNTAGTEITVAVNSDEVVHATLTQGAGGANCDILVATGWDSRQISCAIKSLILKDVASDLGTLRAQTGA